MMDKETYKRELVRMWDSLRTINKGESTCISVKCKECPFNKSVNKSKYGCNGGGFINIFEKIEIVENWSKNHPNIKTVTNRDKLKEIFHIILDEDTEFYLSFSSYSLDDDLEQELIHISMNDWLNRKYNDKDYIKIEKYKDKDYVRKEEK